MKAMNNIILPPLFPGEVLPPLNALFEKSIDTVKSIQSLPLPLDTLKHRLNETLQFHSQSKLSQKDILDTLIILAESWKKKSFPYRKVAEEWLPITTGFSREMIRECLDITLEEFKLDKLTQCFLELGICNTESKFHLHIHAGNVFTSGLFGIIYGLLSLNPQLVKPSSEEPLFPWLFVHSIIILNPSLAAHLAYYNWPGGTKTHEEVVFAYSDKIFAYGDDNTISDMNNRMPSSVQFHGYGHKFSFGFISNDNLLMEDFSEIARRIAYDVALYEQQGCMSPHFILIESDSFDIVVKLGNKLAEEMNSLEVKLPAGIKSIEEKSLIKSIRDELSFQSSLNHGIKLLESNNSLNWTVVCLQNTQVPISCLNRFIYLVLFPKKETIGELLKPFIGKIQTIGYWGSLKQLNGLTSELSALRANRFCLLGEMQKPAIKERHRGKPNPEDFYEKY